ncbi:MAG: right-handed parallel beta-helix repeat-containing protein [Candidatus Acidiferrales bacterium]
MNRQVRLELRFSFLLVLAASIAVPEPGRLLQSAVRQRSGASFPAWNDGAPRLVKTDGMDFYVSPQGNDAGDGSRHRPWATISHAGLAAVPGSTVHVSPGVYREAVVTTASGTPTARIVYISDEKWKAQIVPSSRAVFTWKNTGDYSDIIEFEIGGSLCGGIGLGGSFQRAISNNVHNSAEHCGTSDGGSGIGDFNYASRDNDIIGNYVHDVGISDPLCGQQGHSLIHGIYQANYGGHIHLNVAANNCAWGIHLWHAATHATITNNTVVKNRSGGIVIGSGDSPCSTTGCPGGDDFTIVRNNIVAYNGSQFMGGWGIREESQDPGQIGVHNQYSHNLSFENVSTDFLLLKNHQCANCILGQDPGFVSFSSGDYHLRKKSPAIGAGTVQDVPPLDSSGNSSPPNTSVDIGAFPEFGTHQN